MLSLMSDDENARLLRAMTILARKRDEPSRKTMYRALLSARLYVPTEPDTDAVGSSHFAQDEPLHGRCVYVAFTSLADLERWRPESTEHTVMTGREFFPVLAQSDLGSCLINPKGDVRGELYAHEVVMLSDAVDKLQAWRDGRTVH